MITASRGLTSAEIADHYEDLDRFYRAIWGEHVHHGYWEAGTETPEEAVERLVELVASQAEIGAGSEVCDIGSGYGAAARHLAREHRARVTALTIVPAQHRHALAAGDVDGSVTYLLRDWEGNGLGNACFDAAYAVESTEHMADKPRAFVEAARVLRPGGRLVVCAWIAADRPRRWQRRHLLQSICDDGRLPGMGTEAEYRGMLEAAGFRVSSVHDLSDRVRRTWTICLRRTVAGLAHRRDYREYLLDRASRNREFALTLGRIWLAYRTRAMRYLVFTATRG